jgi:hypothetical protein
MLTTAAIYLRLAVIFRFTEKLFINGNAFIPLTQGESALINNKPCPENHKFRLSKDI